MFSLAKFDEKIGAKRRALAELIEKREAVFTETDAIAEKVDGGSLEGEALNTEIASLKSKQKEGREIADQVRAIETEIADLQSQRQEREEHNRQVASLQNGQARVAQSNSAVEFSSQARVSVADLSPAQQDHDIASFVRNQYVAHQNRISFKAVCRGEAGDHYRNDRLLAVSDKTAAPTILPPNYMPRVIELLRSRTVIRSMEGVRNVPLLNGNLSIPRHTTGSTAAYAAENANIAASDIATDDIDLTEKKLTVLVVSSGELVRQASPAADALIRDDMIRGLAVKEDSTFLRAAGSSTIPKGLKAFADATSSTQVIAANATVNLANVTTDLGKLQLALANADVPMLNGYYILSPRSENYLMYLRDGNGNLAFPEMRDGRLMGFPYKVTTSIPINLGTSPSNKSEVYFVDASELIIADSPLFDVAVSTEAAYWDGSAVQAAFSKDQVVFRLMVGHDTGLRHAQSVAYLSGVTWGV